MTKNMSILEKMVIWIWANLIICSTEHLLQTILCISVSFYLIQNLLRTVYTVLAAQGIFTPSGEAEMENVITH